MRRPGCFAALLSVVVAFAVVAAPVPAGAQTSDAPVILEPKAHILVEANTGKVLAGHEIDLSLHPASTAKIMTALTAVERLAPDADVTVDSVAAAVEANKVGFAVGTTWTFEQMMAVMMMESANDAAYAIAIAAGGSLAGFEAQMMETAQRIGLTNTVLNDPAGLDTWASYKAGPYMSARDLAIVTRNALAVPAISKWAALRNYEFTDPNGVHRTLLNHNRMLAGGAFEYSGSDGFKTGFTNRAQHTLVATATRDGRTLIAVILGSPVAPYQKAAQLLDAGFAMPLDAPGIGDPLPPVNVTTYADRAAGKEAFALLGSAPAVAGTANLPPASIQPLKQSPRAATPEQTVIVAKSSGGILTVRNLVIVVLLLGVATFMLRRRAVKRQRARRMAQRKRRMAAIRSGGLPVVDGRYRSGMRLGPPVESHVRVRRFDDR